jgi:hypothetical protein
LNTLADRIADAQHLARVNEEHIASVAASTSISKLILKAQEFLDSILTCIKTGESVTEVICRSSPLFRAHLDAASIMSEHGTEIVALLLRADLAKSAAKERSLEIWNSLSPEQLISVPADRLVSLLDWLSALAESGDGGDIEAPHVLRAQIGLEAVVRLLHDADTLCGTRAAERILRSELQQSPDRCLIRKAPVPSVTLEALPSPTAGLVESNRSEVQALRLDGPAFVILFSDSLAISFENSSISAILPLGNCAISWNDSSDSSSLISIKSSGVSSASIDRSISAMLVREGAGEVVIVPSSMPFILRLWMSTNTAQAARDVAEWLEDLRACGNNIDFLTLRRRSNSRRNITLKRELEKKGESDAITAAEEAAAIALAEAEERARQDALKAVTLSTPKETPSVIAPSIPSHASAPTQRPGTSVSIPSGPAGLLVALQASLKASSEGKTLSTSNIIRQATGAISAPRLQKLGQVYNANETRQSSTAVSTSASTSSSYTYWRDIPISYFAAQMLQPLSGQAAKTASSSLKKGASSSEAPQPSSLWLRSVEPGEAAEMIGSGSLTPAAASASANKLLEIYANAGQASSSMAFASHVRSYGVEPTASTYRLVGLALLNAGQVDTLDELFRCLPIDIRLEETGIFSVMLEYFERYGFPGRVKELIAGGGPTHKLLASLIRAYGRAGDISSAASVLRQHLLPQSVNPYAPLQPDTIVVDALIDACSYVGESALARALFESLVSGDTLHAQALVPADGLFRASPGNASAVSAAAGTILSTRGSGFHDPAAPYSHVSPLDSSNASSVNTGIGSLSFLNTPIGLQSARLLGREGLRAGSNIVSANAPLTAAEAQNATLFELIANHKQFGFMPSKGLSFTLDDESSSSRYRGVEHLLEPRASSYAALISAYSACGLREQAEAILTILSVRCDLETAKLKAQFIVPSALSSASRDAWRVPSSAFDSLIKAHSEVGDVKGVSAVLQRMEKTGFVEASPSSAAAVLVSLWNAGHSSAAISAFACLSDSPWYSDHPSISSALLRASEMTTSSIGCSSADLQRAVADDKASAAIVLAPTLESILDSLFLSSSAVSDPETRVVDAVKKIREARILASAPFVEQAAKLLGSRGVSTNKNPAAVAALKQLVENSPSYLRTGESGCLLALAAASLSCGALCADLIQSVADPNASRLASSDTLSAAFAAFLSASSAASFAQSPEWWAEAVNQCLSLKPIKLNLVSVQVMKEVEKAAQSSAAVVADILFADPDKTPSSSSLFYLSDDASPFDRESHRAELLEAIALGTKSEHPFFNVPSATGLSGASKSSKRCRSVALTMANIAKCYTASIKGCAAFGSVAGASKMLNEYISFLKCNVLGHKIWRRSMCADLRDDGVFDSNQISSSFSDLLGKSKVGRSLVIVEAAECLSLPYVTLLEALLKEASSGLLESKLVTLPQSGFKAGLSIDLSSPGSFSLIINGISSIMANEGVLPSPQFIEAAASSFIMAGKPETVAPLISSSIYAILEGFSSTEPYLPSETLPLLAVKTELSESIVTLRLTASALERNGKAVLALWRSYIDMCVEKTKCLKDVASTVLSKPSEALKNDEKLKAEGLMSLDEAGRSCINYNVHLSFLHAVAACTDVSAGDARDRFAIESEATGGAQVDLINPEVSADLAHKAVNDMLVVNEVPDVHVLSEIINIYTRCGLAADARLLARLVIAPLRGEDYSRSALQRDLDNDAAFYKEAVLASFSEESKVGDSTKTRVTLPLHILERLEASNVSLLRLGISNSGEAFGAVPVSGGLETYLREARSSTNVWSNATESTRLIETTILKLTSSSFSSLVLALGSTGAPTASGLVRTLLTFASEQQISGGDVILDAVAGLCAYAALVEAEDVDSAEAFLGLSLEEGGADFSVVSPLHGQSSFSESELTNSFNLLWSQGRGFARLPRGFSRGVATRSRDALRGTLEALRVAALCSAGKVHAALRLLELYINNNASSAPGVGSAALRAGLLPDLTTLVLRVLSRLPKERLLARPAEDLPMSSGLVPYARANELLGAGPQGGSSTSSKSSKSSNRSGPVGIFDVHEPRLNGLNAPSSSWSSASIIERLELVLAPVLSSRGWRPSAEDACSLMRIYSSCNRTQVAVLIGWQLVKEALELEGGSKSVSSAALQVQLKRSFMSSSSSLSSSSASLSINVSDSISNSTEPLHPFDVNDIIELTAAIVMRFGDIESGETSKDIVRMWVSPLPSISSPQKDVTLQLNHPAPFSIHDEKEIVREKNAPHGTKRIAADHIGTSLLPMLLYVYATAPPIAFESGLSSPEALKVILSVARHVGIGLGETAEAIYLHAIRRLRIAGAYLTSSSAPAPSPRGLFLSTANAASDPDALVADVGGRTLSSRRLVHTLMDRLMLNVWMPSRQESLSSGNYRLPLFPFKTSSIVLKLNQLPTVINGSESDDEQMTALPSKRLSIPTNVLISLFASAGCKPSVQSTQRKPEPFLTALLSLDAHVDTISSLISVPSPLLADPFLAAARLPIDLVTPSTEKVGGFAISRGSSSPTKQPRFGSGVLIAPSTTSADANYLDAETKKAEASVLVLQMEFDELIKATAAAEEELKTLDSYDILTQMSPKKSSPGKSTDSGLTDFTFAKQSSRLGGAHVQRVREQTEVLKKALAILSEEEKQLSYTLGLSQAARASLSRFRVAANKLDEQGEAATLELSDAAKRAEEIENEILTPLLYVQSSSSVKDNSATFRAAKQVLSKLPSNTPVKTIASNLIAIQTSRLAASSRVGILENDDAAAQQEAAPIHASAAFSIIREREVVDGKKNMDRAEQLLANEEQDMVELLKRENVIRGEILSLRDKLHARERESRSSTGPLAAVVNKVENSRKRLEAAAARHAIDRRVAVANQLDSAVSSIRIEGEAAVAEARSKFAKAAEDFTLEYRRKSEAAQDKLKKALEAELIPIAAAAEADTRMSERKIESLRQELLALEEEIDHHAKSSARFSNITDSMRSERVRLRRELTSVGGKSILAALVDASEYQLHTENASNAAATHESPQPTTREDARLGIVEMTTLESVHDGGQAAIELISGILDEIEQFSTDEANSFVNRVVVAESTDEDPSSSIKSLPALLTAYEVECSRVKVNAKADKQKSNKKLTVPVGYYGNSVVSKPQFSMLKTTATASPRGNSSINTTSVIIKDELVAPTTNAEAMSEEAMVRERVFKRLASRGGVVVSASN